MSMLFVTYGRHDLEFTQKLVAGLREFGIGGYLHPLEGSPEGELPSEITQDLGEADGMLLVLGPQTGRSRLLMKEVGEALLHQKRIIQVLGPQAKSRDVVPSLLRDLQPIDPADRSTTEVCAAVSASLSGSTAKIELEAHRAARRQRFLHMARIIAAILALPLVVAAGVIGMMLMP